MNTDIPVISKAEHDARALAVSILAGETQPYGRGGIYTAREWLAAAQYLIDSDDWSEVSYMIGQEELGPECERWADEADYRYDMARDAEMVAAWEAEQ